VQVHVVRDPGARDPSEVPAEVEAVGLVDRGERVETLPREPVNVERFRVVEIGEAEAVTVRRDEQVTRRVRELVQQDERPLAPMHDELLLVVPLGCAAEDAAVLLVGALHVFEAPGGPETL
jgi:hypothetical protein